MKEITKVVTKYSCQFVW